MSRAEYGKKYSKRTYEKERVEEREGGERERERERERRGREGERQEEREG